MRHRMLQPVAGKAERDQRIVVRPDRPVVIGHRIVARLALRDGADAPAGEEAFAHEIDGDAARTVLAYDAGKQELPGVGGMHPALRLGAIERECVGAELLAPERRLKTLGKKLRLGLQLPHHVEAAQPPGAARCQPLGGEHIALHFGKRDMPLGQTAVGVEDGVEGILPALIGESELAGAPVFDKAVIVGIAGTIDPLQRRFDRRP